ncbi:sulfatase-like hydrolase/transferase [Cohnella fermenti]|uniref:Sulfatase N-terminal domain-containing protein n=1 Tax=Cohnella fermenti TaxID=2565925 RepID=A0A4S4C143_9BACL|nr:sulfatase-like hydrolase/transferase [Cohnella fermenti]THF80789.1 hypothetical protein E6C55_09910 [Cohnella fermenti]
MIYNTALLENKIIVVFGAGRASTETIMELVAAGWIPQCCIDNDPQKWGGNIEGIQIQSVEWLKNNKEKRMLIIIASMYYAEMAKQLSEIGFCENIDFISYKHLTTLNGYLKYIAVTNGLEYTNKSYYVKYLYRYLKFEGKHQKVAIWGGSEHTQRIFASLENLNINLIVDPDYQNLDPIGGIEVKSVNALIEEAPDVVLISSYEDRQRIKEYIRTNFSNIDCLDIYDIFEGVVEFKEPFHSWLQTRYQPYIEMKMLVSQINQPGLEKKILQYTYCQLLAFLLHIKDFERFEMYVHRYEMVDKEDARRFLKIIDEIKDMLHNANKRAANRTTKDLLLFVIDSLRYEDVDKLSYLKDLRQHSIQFNRAYSVSTYTSASYRGMFSETLHDGNDYSYKEIDGSTSSLLSWLNDHNYKTFTHGGVKISGVENFINVAYPGNIMHPMTFRWWDAFCQLVDCEDPQAHIINISEAHFPFMCCNDSPTLNLTYNVYYSYNDPTRDVSGSIRQLDESISFINHQLNRISQYFASNTTLVFCSDHGTKVGGPVGHVVTCEEDIIHVPLIINSPNTEPEIITSLFSLKRLCDLIKGLLQDNQIEEELFSDHVVVERGPIYFEMYSNDPNFSANAGSWMKAFKMVRNDSFKYILFQDGEEWFFNLPNEKNNEINNVEYLGALEDLRKKVSDYFPYVVD